MNPAAEFLTAAARERYAADVARGIPEYIAANVAGEVDLSERQVAAAAEWRRRNPGESPVRTVYRDGLTFAEDAGL